MKKNKNSLRKEALEIVYRLFENAKSEKSKADDFVRKARRIAMKVNMPLPKELKIKFCKHCYTYFKNKNYRARTRNKIVIYYCLKCRKFSKFLMSQNIQKSKRKKDIG